MRLARVAAVAIVAAAASSGEGERGSKHVSGLKNRTRAAAAANREQLVHLHERKRLEYARRRNGTSAGPGPPPRDRRPGEEARQRGKAPRTAADELVAEAPPPRKKLAPPKEPAAPRPTPWEAPPRSWAGRLSAAPAALLAVLGLALTAYVARCIYGTEATPPATPDLELKLLANEHAPFPDPAIDDEVRPHVWTGGVLARVDGPDDDDVASESSWHDVGREAAAF